MSGRSGELRRPLSINRVLGLNSLPKQSVRDRQVLLLTHQALNWAYSNQEHRGTVITKDRFLRSPNLCEWAKGFSFYNLCQLMPQEYVRPAWTALEWPWKLHRLYDLFFFSPLCLDWAISVYFCLNWYNIHIALSEISAGHRGRSNGNCCWMENHFWVFSWKKYLSFTDLHSSFFKFFVWLHKGPVDFRFLAQMLGPDVKFSLSI